MTYQETIGQINSHRKEMMALREKMRALQTSIEPEAVEDYVFSTSDGEVKLSDLFAGKDTLFVVHNMGTSCAYCTQWADGLNGVLDHLKDRAAFVVSSPDVPKVQAAFAKGRGWDLTMVSHKGTNFADDMGYKGDSYFTPGISVFRKQQDKVLRVSDTQFGPGDDFNPVWNLFDLIPEGSDGWQPKFDYS